MSREKRLKREMLVTVVKKICSTNYKDFTVSELIHKGGQRHRIEIIADDLSFYLDFHFKENGSTSIDVSSGQHIDIKKQFMAAILHDDTCLMVNDKS